MKNILYCPIDLPKCPLLPTLKKDFVWHFWEVTKLTVNHDNPYQITDFTDEVKTMYPSLVNWFNLFPCKSVRNIKVNKQISSVKPHIDFTKPDLDKDLHLNNSLNEPCGYRIVLSGSRTNKLYVMNNGQKIYCTLPEDTDVYVLGHTSTLHGVEDDENRITIFTHFEIDTEKHQLLLSKSLEKYQKYAIFE